MRAADDNGEHYSNYEINGLTLTMHDHPYAHLEALNRNLNNMARDVSELLGVPFKNVFLETIDDIYTVLYAENMKREAYNRETKDKENGSRYVPNTNRN